MGRLRVTIVAMEAGAGHVCQLAKAMTECADVIAVWHHESAYGLDYIFPEAKIGFEHIPREGDVFIYVGPVLWQRLDKSILKGYKDIKIIIVDGQWMRRQVYYNNEFKDYDVLTNNCKFQFAWFPVREFYQPFDLSHVKIEKAEPLRVGHSIFNEDKRKQKGTQQIIDTVGRKDIDFDLMTGLNWDEVIERKSKCNIFVDQIDHFAADEFNWNGGIGKSGLEAMLLDCLVICWGEFERRELPVPPIAWCTKWNFEEVLDYYINNEDARNKKIKEQREWADVYLNPNYCARRVLQVQEAV